MTWPSRAAAELLADLTRHLDEVLPQANTLRRDIHRHPDLGDGERATVDRLRKAMPGQRATRVAETGFLTRVGPPEGPAVAVRAELDALPLTEETDAPWASVVPGVMHACGHDVHLAATWALLQAARKIEHLPVGLLGVFQPREEVQPCGGADVVGSAALADHDIRAVIGAHVQPRVPAGVVSTGTGGVNAAADAFDIVIHGQPGHGAYPHLTIDPIPALASIVLGLQELVGRSIDPVHPALITVGQVTGGTAHNIIPASASLHGIIRTMHTADQEHLHEAVRHLAEFSARARGARAEVTIIVGDPVLSNDTRLVQTVDPLLEAAGIMVAHQPFRSLGADDFSHYSRVAPILMMFVGTGHGPTTDGRHEIGLHHPRYLPGEDAVHRTALALAAGFVGGAHVAGAL
ncbi:MAG: M20 family metallopeptidase [Propionicimonas sp.]